jgi:hypothetical protein
MLDYVLAEFYSNYEERRDKMLQNSYILECLRNMTAANMKNPEEYPSFSEYMDMANKRELKQDKPVDLKSGDDKWAETLKRIEERKNKHPA